jgi:hypothetical protein
MDIEIHLDGELEIVQVEAQTEAGEDFINAYMPDRAGRIQVLDSGSIIIPSDELTEFARQCEQRDLTIGGV